MRRRFLTLVPALGLILVHTGVDAAALRAIEPPVPSVGSGVELERLDRPPVTPPALPPVLAAPKPVFGAPPLLAPGIDCFNYDTNLATAGTVLVPPDPHCAVGQNHIVVIGNVTIEWRPKEGTTALPQYQASLKSFFSGLPGPPAGPGTTLGTNGFDPKVIYDQYANRYIVVALERTDAPNPTESRILIAVSKFENPNDGWWLFAVNSKMNIGGLDRWADYPGIAVDDKALYITNNMFAFAAGGSVYGGTRLWIVKKNPTFNGPNNNIAVNVYNPFIDPLAVANTAQPAHMYGPPGTGSGGRSLGTFLTTYSGLVDGAGEDFIQIVEVTDPLSGAGGPFFTLQQIDWGNLDNGAVMPDAPQLGLPAYPIETNDRRALNAVWRSGNLYTCATIVPAAGVDAGQATAHWWRINTTTPVPGLVLAEQGDVGGELIGAQTYTFFPAVMVDSDLNLAIAFAASNSAIYCGAYYTTRFASDPAGTTSAPGTLQSGVAPYKRFHSGNRNRWGDYTGLALCPVTESTFYLFNEYAGPTGTPGTGSNGSENGRWFTKLGWFRIKLPTPVGDTGPLATRLAQNIPNPFNPSTTIHFTLAQRAHATLEVFDAGGRWVCTLLDETRSAGAQAAQWDGRDARGDAVASGVYFYRLTAGGVSHARKMILLK